MGCCVQPMTTKMKKLRREGELQKNKVLKTKLSEKETKAKRKQGQSKHHQFQQPRPEQKSHNTALPTDPTDHGVPTAYEARGEPTSTEHQAKRTMKQLSPSCAAITSS